MAVIGYTKNDPTGGAETTINLVAWTPLTNTGADSGYPMQLTDWADRAVQVFGTFGAGGTVVLEGSNDNVNWSTLTDQNGNAMSYTAATVKQMTEAPIYVRPRITAGDGTTSLTVSIAARRLTMKVF